VTGLSWCFGVRFAFGRAPLFLTQTASRGLGMIFFARILSRLVAAMARDIRTIQPGEPGPVSQEGMDRLQASIPPPGTPARPVAGFSRSCIQRAPALDVSGPVPALVAVPAGAIAHQRDVVLALRTVPCQGRQALTPLPRPAGGVINLEPIRERPAGPKLTRAERGQS